jgi:fructose-bisphosphate aldolase, class I
LSTSLFPSGFGCGTLTHIAVKKWEGNMSVLPRINRLFSPSGRCFVVALDHGIHNEWRFLSGLEDMRSVVAGMASAGPDALLLSPGMAPFLQQLRGKEKPSLVLRTDPTNLYGPPSNHYFCQMIERPIEQALRLDAVAVIANLLLTPDQPGLYRQCLRNIMLLKAQCDRYGMPLMVEPLALQRDGESYVADRRLNTMVALVRQAVEVGADIVKADPSGDLKEYGQVVQAAGGKPVLPRGGEKVADSEILARTKALIQAGAAGAVYGRNVFQHDRPGDFARSLKKVIHGDG